MTMDLYHIQGWFGVYHPAFQGGLQDDTLLHWTHENMGFMLRWEPPYFGELS